MRKCISLCALLCAFSLLISCATTMLRDDLRRDSPRGYVEFYKSKSSQGDVDLLDMQIAVYLAQNGQYVHQGTVGAIDWNTRLRIACSPGLHQLAARLGPKLVEAQVEVKENEITPIIITVTQTDVSYSGGKKTFIFAMSLHAKTSVPFDAYETYGNIMKY
jgi:hypothetical protein